MPVTLYPVGEDVHHCIHVLVERKKLVVAGDAGPGSEIAPAYLVHVGVEAAYVADDVAGDNYASCPGDQDSDECDKENDPDQRRNFGGNRATWYEARQVEGKRFETDVCGVVRSSVQPYEAAVFPVSEEAIPFDADAVHGEVLPSPGQ